jgi:hypothetical protein
MKTRFLVPVALALAVTSSLSARSATFAGNCENDGLLTLEANAPLLSSGSLTQLNMAALFATTGQPTSNLVTVTVRNNSDVDRSFRILFELKMIPANDRIRTSCADPVSSAGQEGCWIQRGILVDQIIPKRSVWVRTSSQLESETYQAKSIMPESSPFQQMLGREGYLPQGSIYFNVGLLCPLDGGRQEDVRVLQSLETNANRTFLANYQPTQAPNLVFPGGPASDGYPTIATSTPTFVWTGNLDGVDLGGDSPYRFSLWDLHDEESVGEALDRRPLITAKIDRSPLTWNNPWVPLEPGRRYLWRVDALLRGLTNDWLSSGTYGFRTPVAVGSWQGSVSSGSESPQVGATLGVSSPPGGGGPQATPEQLEILRALSLIIGPYRPALEQVMRTSLPDPYALTISDVPATRTDFQNLVRDILEGRATVVGAEARP